MKEKSWSALMEQYGIPILKRDALLKYLLYGYNPGSFLKAVLSNDLREAYAWADCESQALIGNYVRFLYNEAPIASWGSEENFTTWRGLDG